MDEEVAEPEDPTEVAKEKAATAGSLGNILR